MKNIKAYKIFEDKEARDVDLNDSDIVFIKDIFTDLEDEGFRINVFGYKSYGEDNTDTIRCMIEGRFKFGIHGQYENGDPNFNELDKSVEMYNETYNLLKDCASKGASYGLKMDAFEIESKTTEHGKIRGLIDFIREQKDNTVYYHKPMEY